MVLIVTIDGQKYMVRGFLLRILIFIAGSY
jgi:hypothetical protein